MSRTCQCPACGQQFSVALTESVSVLACPNCQKAVNLSTCDLQLLFLDQGQSSASRVEQVQADPAPTQPLGELTQPEPPRQPNGPTVTVPGYDILKMLGRGGMGVVYQARQVKLNRLVALKMVLAGVHAGTEQLARFQREAEAVARLSHRNIVQIHEVGEHDGLPFFVMEFVQGGTLAGKLQSGPLPPREAAQLLETLARAVQHAHQQGVIHRDLKPANILLAEQPAENAVAKIADFGLAKLLDNDAEATPSGAVMGTPGYMAPEQAQGRSRQVGPATDVYGLGAILYACLTGRPPFQAKDPLDIILQVLNDEPVSPSQVRPGLPADLVSICLKCLDKRPGRRYASALALADDLRRFLDGEPIRARPTSLSQRAVKWARRRPAAALGLALVAFLIFSTVGGALWYWNAYRRVKVEYYAKWVYRLGEPQGVGRLTEEQVRHRRLNWKFYRRAGRVEALESVDARGQPTTQHPLSTFLGSLDQSGGKQPVCRSEFVRNEQGRLTTEVARDRNGEVVWFFHHDSLETGHYSDKNGYIRTASGTGAAYVQFSWSAEGFLQGTRYCDLHRKPQTGSGNIFGYRSELNAHGQEVRRTILGADGQPCLCPDGYSALEMTLDDLGNVTEETFLDTHGKPTLTRQGYARRCLKYDSYGNPTEEGYCDTDNRPAVTKDGYVRMSAGYDEQGNLIQLGFFGPDDRPTLHVQGYAGLAVRYEEGNPVEVTYLDLEGRPTRTKQGVARIKGQFDSQGNILKDAYFDPAGQPTLHTDGDAGFTASYDSKGHLLHQAHFGLDGQPTWIRAGYARKDRKYNSDGLMVEESYSGVDGKPTLHKNGYARIQMEYDERGNITEVAYHDREGRLTVSTGGFARLTRRYDDQGRMSEEAYFDRAGKRVKNKEGVARIIARHDERGNIISRHFLDHEDRPVKNKEGVARIVAGYDDSGNIIEQRYLGPDDKPTRHKAGNFKVRKKYERGNPTETVYLDENDKPVAIQDGYAVLITRYNNQGYVVEQTYLDVNRRPVRTKALGYARRLIEPDAHGNYRKVSFFDNKGNPTMSNEGFAWVINTFDARGNLTERAYFDNHRKPTAGWHRELRTFDDWGREVEVVFRDAEGRLATGDDDSARIKTRYDTRGNRIERAYYDKNNRPHPDYFKERMDRDNQGNIVEATFFDTNN